MISPEELTAIFRKDIGKEKEFSLVDEPERHIEAVRQILLKSFDSGRFNFVKDQYYDGNLAEEQYFQIIVSYYLKHHHTLLALTKGDEIEWQKLWERLYKQAYHQLIRYGWSKELAEGHAEEVTQETCVTIFHQSPLKYYYDCSFDAWSSSILLNAIRHNYQREHDVLGIPDLFTFFSLEDDDGPPDNYPLAKTIISKQLSVDEFFSLDQLEQLGWAIQQLSSQAQRQVIVGIYFQGLTALELAQQLQKTTQAIFNLKHQAVKNLRGLLNTEEP